MRKRDIPVYQVTSEYAGCLEESFGLRGGSGPQAASDGPESSLNLGGGGGGDRILGAMGNTPLGTRHIGELSEDTCHLSVWCHWGFVVDSLFQRLNRAQRDARKKAERIEPTEETELVEDIDVDPMDFIPQEDLATSGGGVFEGFMEAPGNDWFEFGGQAWRVKAHGVGGKDGRSYYPYAIHAGGVLIAFRRDKHDTVSNMWIELGSIPLAQNGGLDGMWKILLGMFGKEGIHVEKTIVSRVDIFADFDGVEVAEFCERFFNNNRVTRARRIGLYQDEMNTAAYFSGHRYTGFSIGTNIKLRCYDKRYELRNDPIKWGVMAERYNGIPEVLTRVEFQLRRVALKEFLLQGCERIDGVESYLAAREQLWLYLTEDWFRLTEEEADKKNRHQDRAKTWSVWERVQQAVAGVVKFVFRHPRAPRMDMEALYRQGLGCICKMAIYEKGTELETADAVLKYFYAKVREHGSREFWEVMNRHFDDVHKRLGFRPLLGVLGMGGGEGSGACSV